MYLPLSQDEQDAILLALPLLLLDPKLPDFQEAIVDSHIDSVSQKFLSSQAPLEPAEAALIKQAVGLAFALLEGKPTPFAPFLAADFFLKLAPYRSTIRQLHRRLAPLTFH